MPSCIGMLGNSEHTIKVFSSSLAKEGVDMLPKEFLTIEDIIEALTDEIDAVFIADRACKGVIGGREEILKKLRAADSTVRIIFCCDSDKQDEEFENWCHHHRIGDIFYPEDNGKGEMSIAIKPLARCVKKGRHEPFEDEPPNESVRAVEAPKGSAFIKSAGSLIAQLGDTLQKSKPKVVEKVVERVIYRDRDVPGYSDAGESIMSMATGTVIIGVFNICRGAGATTMAVEIAKECGKRGTRVYIIAADGSDDLEYSKVKQKNVRYSVDPNIDASLLDAMCCGTQMIIFDFGLLLETDRNGNITTALARLNKTVERLSTCKLKIAMGLSAEWHLTKLTPFICGQYPKITPTHLILDKRVSGINFPDVFTREQMPSSAIVDEIGVNKRRRGL